MTATVAIAVCIVPHTSPSRLLHVSFYLENHNVNSKTLPTSPVSSRPYDRYLCPGAGIFDNHGRRTSKRPGRNMEDTHREKMEQSMSTHSLTNGKELAVKYTRKSK
ncbi:hypothetical protein D6C77_09197 [Aureobasidium pullulans]|nr:hypothetical protein D6C77_09197 [Aureobasidium pullulans]